MEKLKSSNVSFTDEGSFTEITWLAPKPINLATGRAGPGRRGPEALIHRRHLPYNPHPARALAPGGNFKP